MQPQNQAAIDRVQGLLAWLGVNTTERRRCLALRLIGRGGRAEIQPSRREDGFEWLGPVASADELSLTPPHPVVVVFLDDDTVNYKRAAEVVGRLRDFGGGCVLIADEVGSILSERELLALGYVRRQHPTSGVGFYLYDPDDFFPAREWNNAERWANPENYDRYRW